MIAINKKYYGCFDPLPKRPYKPTAIVIHHTCTKSPERTQKALKEKNYSTHFEVDKDGTIYQYADVNLTASHCCGVNSHVIGIDLTHLKDKPFPQVQVDAAKELVSYLCREYGILQVVHTTLEGIWPHCALGNTICPGGVDMAQFGVCHMDDIDAILALVDSVKQNGRLDELREALKNAL